MTTYLAPTRCRTRASVTDEYDCFLSIARSELPPRRGEVSEYGDCAQCLASRTQSCATSLAMVKNHSGVGICSSRRSVPGLATLCVAGSVHGFWDAVALGVKIAGRLFKRLCNAIAKELVPKHGGSSEGKYPRLRILVGCTKVIASKNSCRGRKM